MRASPFIVGLVALVATAGVAFAQVNGPKVKSDATQGVGGTLLGQALMHAVVNADGTTARGDGNLSSAKVAGFTGAYDVRFRRAITSCAFEATPGLAAFSGSIAPTFIQVVGRVGTTNGVFIQTNDAAGSPVDQGFHLVVKC